MTRNRSRRHDPTIQRIIAGISFDSLFSKKSGLTAGVSLVGDGEEDGVTLEEHERQDRGEPY
jgi:hypothetical protein